MIVTIVPDYGVHKTIFTMTNDSINIWVTKVDTFQGPERDKNLRQGWARPHYKS